MNTKKIFLGLTVAGVLYYLFRDNKTDDVTEDNVEDNTKNNVVELPAYSNNGLQNLYIKNYNFSDPANLVDACKTLINEIETKQKTSGYQIFEGTFGYKNLYMYRGSAYPNYSMLQYSVFTITNIATGNSYKFGYSGGNWYFNSL